MAKRLTSHFKKAIPSLAGSAQRGTFFRSIDLRYLATPLSAVGSIRTGGRYNAKGAFEALYIADTQETTLHETNAVFNFNGKIVAKKQPPRVILSIDVTLQYVIDLRDPKVQEKLKITMSDLRAPWLLAQEEGRYIVTQDIGDVARACHVEALLYPSATLDGATNLVIFTDRLRKGSIIELYVGDGEDTPMPRVTLTGEYEKRPPPST